MPPTARAELTYTTSRASHDPSDVVNLTLLRTIPTPHFFSVFRVSIFCGIVPHAVGVHYRTVASGLWTRFSRPMDVDVRWHWEKPADPCLMLQAQGVFGFHLPSPHSQCPTRAAGYLERRPSEPRGILDARYLPDQVKLDRKFSSSGQIASIIFPVWFDCGSD
jgi:hypothetical protein